MTRKARRAGLRRNLARAATRLGLGATSSSTGARGRRRARKPSILADTMEAVIAAVYLDAGMEEAAKLVDLAMDGYETSEKRTTATPRVPCRSI